MAELRRKHVQLDRHDVRVRHAKPDQQNKSMPHAASTVRASNLRTPSAMVRACRTCSVASMWQLRAATRGLCSVNQAQSCVRGGRESHLCSCRRLASRSSRPWASSQGEGRVDDATNASLPRVQAWQSVSAASRGVEDVLTARAHPRRPKRQRLGMSQGLGQKTSVVICCIRLMRAWCRQHGRMEFGRQTLASAARSDQFSMLAPIIPCGVRGVQASRRSVKQKSRSVQWTGSEQ